MKTETALLCSYPRDVPSTANPLVDTYHSGFQLSCNAPGVAASINHGSQPITGIICPLYCVLDSP